MTTGNETRRLWWSLLRRAALPVVAAGLLLTGCSAAPLYPGPTFTVRSLFLYVRRGDMESAWQEFGPVGQVSNPPAAAVAPDGRPATRLRWLSYAAFRRDIRSDLAPFLSGARVTGQEGVTTASVVAYAQAPSSAVAYAQLTRVDNEWVVQSLVVTRGQA